MAAETDPAWLVALSRRSDAGLKSLPPTSQPAWYRVRVYEPRLVEESESAEASQQQAVGA